ncbi:hypothetical protein AB3N61_18680 [Leptospira sp. WS58.C1]|uniref:hypothetical protein n=1 Tax=Leptospira cinconiae TaxID=3235173 RepID=UPI00349E95C1
MMEILIAIFASIVAAYIYDLIKPLLFQKSIESLQVKPELSAEGRDLKSRINPSTEQGVMKFTVENYDRLLNFIDEGKFSEELNITAEEVVFFEEKQKKVLENLNITFRKNSPPAKIFILRLDGKKAFANPIKFEFDDETNEKLNRLSISNIKQHHPFVFRIISSGKTVNLNIVPKYDRQYSIYDLKEWYSFILCLGSSKELRLDEKSNSKSFIPIDLKSGSFAESDMTMGCEANLKAIKYIEFLKTKGIFNNIHKLPIFMKYKDLVKIFELNEFFTNGFVEKKHATLTAGLFRKQIFFLLKEKKCLQSMMFADGDYLAKDTIFESANLEIRGFQIELKRFQIRNRILLLFKSLFYFYRKSFQVEFIPFDETASMRIRFTQVKQV